MIWPILQYWYFSRFRDGQIDCQMALVRIEGACTGSFSRQRDGQVYCLMQRENRAGGRPSRQDPASISAASALNGRLAKTVEAHRAPGHDLMLGLWRQA